MHITIGEKTTWTLYPAKEKTEVNFNLEACILLLKEMEILKKK